MFLVFLEAVGLICFMNIRFMSRDFVLYCIGLTGISSLVVIIRVP
jgi:hypothetical protein